MCTLVTTRTAAIAVSSFILLAASSDRVFAQDRPLQPGSRSLHWQRLRAFGEYDAPMDSTAPNARPGYWLWIAVAWAGIGLIDACETVFPMRAQGMHHAWVSLFATRVLVWLPWALATPSRPQRDA